MKQLFALPIALVLLSSCSPSADKLKETIEKNPEIITNLFAKHPELMSEAINKAVREAQRNQFTATEKSQAEIREDEFKNPKEPNIASDRAVRGNKNAPITIVEYTDFACLECKKAHDTLLEVSKKYGDKVRLVYKHFPMNSNPIAMPAALYYEAVLQQSPGKANKLYSLLFANQDKLIADNEAYLQIAAKEVRANLEKLNQDVTSEEIIKNIADDLQEAQGFGFVGAPGFLVNGVSIRGAFGIDEFSKIIDRHLEK